MATHQTTSEFEILLAQVRDGSEKATTELVERYGRQLLLFVRRKMRRGKLRSKFDSVDFVQSIWAAFFAVSGRMDDFNTADSLVRYLSGMAKNRLANEFRKRFELLKYNIKLEVDMDEPRSTALPADVPSASQVAIAREVLDRILEGRTELQQQVIKLRLSGHRYVEIASMLRIDEGSARRIVREVHRDLEHEYGTTP
jgi:RNA polymerase sigma-70 factor (ECF subfamily)